MKKYLIIDMVNPNEEVTEMTRDDFFQSLGYNIEVAVEYEDFKNFEEALCYVLDELHYSNEVEINGFIYKIEEVN